MKKSFSRIITLLLCAVVIISLASCGNKGDTWSTEDGAMNKVTDNKGGVIGYERRYHNENGDITRLDVYDENEVYDHYIVYEYDDDHRLVKETTYRADGIGDHYYEYTYYDDGTLKEKDYLTMSDGSERILYNPDGTAKERFVYDASDNLTKHEICENGVWKSAPLEEPSEAATEDKKEE